MLHLKFKPESQKWREPGSHDKALRMLRLANWRINPTAHILIAHVLGGRLLSIWLGGASD